MFEAWYLDFEVRNQEENRMLPFGVSSLRTKSSAAEGASAKHSRFPFSASDPLQKVYFGFVSVHDEFVSDTTQHFLQRLPIFSESSTLQR